MSSQTSDADRERYPELFVLLVSALGANVDPVQDALDTAFRAVGYSARHVRISQLITEANDLLWSEQRPADQCNPAWLMTLGDRLREESALPAAAAHLALLRIRGQRGDATERPGTVTIIRSAKRDEEVDLLRVVYGSRLLVLGVSSSEEERRRAISDRLKREHHDQHELWSQADELLERDQSDSANPWGQRLRKAFGKADAFIWLRSGVDIQARVERLVKLWFGEPFTTPTRDEQAMFHASAAQFRSAAAGRQVGVSIVDESGEVLVTGTNDVPKPGGGQYWAGDTPDHRDFQLSYETNDRGKLDVVLDVVGRLADAGWLASDRAGVGHRELVSAALAEDGPLRGSRISDLIEFGRIVHAEMAAICTAARRGTSLAGSVLYSTTYPCHECARLIIAAGIRKVVYVDPYPKSQVQMLFADLVTDDPAGAPGSKIQMVPFEGVAPRLFPDVFRINQRERDGEGTFEPWVPVPFAVRSSLGVQALADEVTALDTFMATNIGQAWLPDGPVTSGRPSAGVKSVGAMVLNGPQAEVGALLRRYQRQSRAGGPR